MAMNRNQLIFWMLVFILVINVAAMATFFIRTAKPVPVSPVSTTGKQGFALQNVLGLTNAQKEKVNSINEIFRATSEPIMQDIRQRKTDLLDELSKENSDTLKIMNLAAQVGESQTRLQVLNAKQFLEIKKICTPEQTKKLTGLYSGLYGCNGNGQGRGPGNGMGGRHRHRYGQQNTDSIPSN
jgi:Spy/CpxP family protein refolding chaperone